MRKSVLVLLALAPAAALIASAATAQAALPVTATGRTLFTNVTDSGYNGNWATDRFVQADTVTAGYDFAACPSDAPYPFTATDNDFGNSTTITGANSPGETSVLIARAVAVAMTGGFRGITFCSSSDAPSILNVPASADASTTQGAVLAGEIGTAPWFALFFPAGTLIANFNSTGWGWTYKLDQNPCGQIGSQQWKDDSAVPAAVSGNIIVSACPAPAHPHAYRHHHRRHH